MTIETWSFKIEVICGRYNSSVTSKDDNISIGSAPIGNEDFQKPEKYVFIVSNDLKHLFAA